MKRKFVLVLAFLFIISALSSMGLASIKIKKSDYLGTYRVVNCREYVTLRVGPSTSADAKIRVPLGQTVEAYRYNSKFHHCKYNGLEGYILTKYLAPVSSTDSIDDYNDTGDDEPNITLVFPKGSRGKWRKGKSGSLLMRVKPTNISTSRTVTAFELYMYAEDVWGKKIYGSRYYYATTKRKIKPGKSGWSDYMSLPNRSQIHKVYVGVSLV